MNTAIRSRALSLLTVGFALALLVGAAGPRRVAALAAPSGEASAAGEVAQVAVFEAETYSLDDPYELEVFIDDIMTAQSTHFPGMVVAVVKDGKLLLAKGYGYADLEARKPVDAERTLFHVGSVAKLFTCTAVMQLVEQGRLDLDADVNTYLDFRVPATYPQPVTLRHLLTHTAGFEMQMGGEFVAGADDLVPLGQYLASHIPARVYAPGEITAYSNYGASLAGFIVERVSGVPFEQYVEEQIFRPLGMAYSTFRQVDRSPALAADMAVGYSYADGAFVAAAPEYLQVIPAGALLSTATDMARFMIAHLQNGQYGEGRILQEATAQEMHSQQFTNDPRVSGWTFGFQESYLNNLRIIGHGGDTYIFHTLLSLIPEQNLGLFVSYNSWGSGEMSAIEARDELLRVFLDRYYPAEQSLAPQPPEGFAGRAGRYTGSYESTDCNYSTPDKFNTQFRPVTIRATKQDTLLVRRGSSSMELVETGPLEFVSLEDQRKVVFRENQDGQITAFFMDGVPDFGFIKLPWYAVPALHKALLLACLSLFGIALIALPVQLAAERRRSRATGQAQPRLPRLALWTGTAVALLNAAFALSNAFVVVSANPSPAVMAIMTIPVVAALLALCMVGFTILVWKDRIWRVGARLLYTLVTLAALVFVLVVNFWHLWIIGL